MIEVSNFDIISFCKYAKRIDIKYISVYLQQQWTCKENQNPQRNRQQLWNGFFVPHTSKM